ncbi:hypothetical protein [Paraburkholderia sediminicola]|uniref:hypothetical protein n=1 Tax=Paraburkholderia sediminicola TaxID=458836 RepID=UPI0038BA361B
MEPTLSMMPLLTTAVSMTKRATNSRRFVPWWAKSPARAFGAQLLHIGSCYVLQEGGKRATWQSDLLLLHAVWHDFRTLSMCSGRRCPPIRIKYTVPLVSEYTGFAREGLLEWIIDFQWAIAATAKVLPPIPGLSARVHAYWRDMRAIAEVAGGRWPSTVERLMWRTAGAVDATSVVGGSL